MPQQANQPGTSPIPGQQEGKAGQWSPAEGDPSAPKKQQQQQQDHSPDVQIEPTAPSK